MTELPKQSIYNLMFERFHHPSGWRRLYDFNCILDLMLMMDATKCPWCEAEFQRQNPVHFHIVEKVTFKCKCGLEHTIYYGTRTGTESF